jgi:hypothetical protein
MGEQKVPKGNQKIRKGSQNVPKWQPKGTKVATRR